MPIDVEWQNERGDTLARYDGLPITGRLAQRAGAASQCLQFVDPYGNTIFNQNQLPILIAELEAVAKQSDDGEIAAIRDLIRFLGQAREQLHTYIKFIGD